MKRNIPWALIAVPLAALLCLALYYGTPVSKTARGNLTLWYAETDCPRPVMEALLDAYRDETRRLVTAAAFPDEASLAAAFESGRPDLLLCSHVRAFDMDEREGLTVLQDMPPLPEAVEGVSPQIGASFFPFGARLPLLVADAGRFPIAPESLEALLGQAEEAGAPFLAADSWADVLYQGMFARGSELHGNLKTDLRDESCKALYNALAQAAYAGALADVSGAAGYVRQGLLPCAIVSSQTLAGLEDASGLRVFPLPQPEGGRAAYSAELMGFAVLAGKKTAGEAKAFLNWLAIGERGAALAPNSSQFDAQPWSMTTGSPSPWIS